MGVKRTADELEPARPASLRRRIKRLKATPQEDGTNSSEASSCSVSEDSALRSSPPASEKGRNSSMSSVEPYNDYDNDTASSSSPSTSDSSESDSGSDVEIITVGGPKKPDFKKARSTDGASDLRERLASLLPQLAEANELLAKKPAAVHNMEDVGDGEQHIEMNLGLGVLEEQGSQSDTSSSSDSDEEDDENESQDDTQISNHAGRKREPDRLGNLMGQSRSIRTEAIQDVG